MSSNGAQSSFVQRQELSADDRERTRHVDAVAWAVFFIWVGVSMLAHVPWGWFLVGLGALAVGAQAARWRMGLGVERFWVSCGALLLAGGAWESWLSHPRSFRS